MICAKDKRESRAREGKCAWRQGEGKCDPAGIIKEAEKVTFEQRLEERRKLSQQIPEENASEAERRTSKEALRQGCV